MKKYLKVEIEGPVVGSDFTAYEELGDGEHTEDELLGIGQDVVDQYYSWGIDVVDESEVPEEHR